MTTATPAWKWAGGKRELLPEIEKHVPETFGHYHEPFVGAGAVFFHLHATGRIRHGATIGDSNAEIVEAFREIRDRPENLIAKLKEAQRLHAEGGARFYYDLRAEDPPKDVAVRFLTLNRLGYNGMYRVNRSGGFNVPYGKWATVPNLCDEGNLRAVARVLRDVVVKCGDFEVCGAPRTNDFVYFNPPYVPTSATADFTSYTADGFGPKEQTRLRDYALGLKKLGCRVLLSNSDTPFARELYGEGFERRRVEARRSVNSATGKRGKVGELLIW